MRFANAAYVLYTFQKKFRMAKDKDIEVTEGTANVFADLGFPDAETHLLKASLASRIQDVIDAEGWTQTEAAKRMGIAQPDVSRILRGRFRDYSVERLLRFLTALGCEIEITVRRRNRDAASTEHISVKSGLPLNLLR